MFGKKKKNESALPEAPPVEDNTKDGKKKGGKKKGDSKDPIPVTVPAQQSGWKKWKFLPQKLFLSKKMMFGLLLSLLLSVGGAGFVVYKIYFAKKNAEKTVIERVYIKKELPNIILAEEIIRFTYDFIPEFYDSSVLFNDEIIIIENEINRLTALGKQFPDQIKIAEKEIKVMEKEKGKLKQTYEKLEKKIEALYVSYRVNQETGFQQIEEQKNDIVASAKDALTPVLELTRRIHAMSAAESKAPPEGFIKGTIYKIRQKINNLIK